MSYTDSLGVELPEAVPATAPARWRRNTSIEPHQGYVMCHRGGDYRMLPRGLDPTLPAPGTIVTYGDAEPIEAMATTTAATHLTVDPAGAPLDATNAGGALAPVEPAAPSDGTDDTELQINIKGKRVHPMILAGVASVIIAWWFGGRR